MTIAELYAWAVENDAEDYPVEIQCIDGGSYYGTRELEKSDIGIELRTYGFVVVL